MNTQFVAGGRRVALPEGMSEAEWEIRCDLAACYQLTDLYGMSDLTANHISARLPGPDHHFLLNRYGMLFDEITASSLIKIDINGNVIGADADELRRFRHPRRDPRGLSRTDLRDAYPHQCEQRRGHAS